MNNLSLNLDKIQFKYTDCKFFRHRLTPEGLKPDPEKKKAILAMQPPQSIQQLQFQWHSQLPKEIQSIFIRACRTIEKATKE